MATPVADYQMMMAHSTKQHQRENNMRRASADMERLIEHIGLLNGLAEKLPRKHIQVHRATGDALQMINDATGEVKGIMKSLKDQVEEGESFKLFVMKKIVNSIVDNMAKTAKSGIASSTPIHSMMPNFSDGPEGEELNSKFVDQAMARVAKPLMETMDGDYYAFLETLEVNAKQAVAAMVANEAANKLRAQTLETFFPQ